MSTLFNYSPESVTALIAGFIPVEGYVNGTFINITKDVLPFTAARTPDGTVARIYNNDQTYTIECTLHSGSNTNDLLTKLWNIDEITNGKLKFPFLLKDNSGSDLFFSTTTWIESPPAMVKSTGVDGRTWTLRSAFATINLGSNSDPSDLIEDLANTIVSALPALNGIV